MKRSQASAAIFAALTALLLAACSGTEVIPDDTSAFAAKNYRGYAWRTDPLVAQGFNKNQIYEVDPAVRLTVNKRMQELGYREVSRDEAGFLIEYFAASGVAASRLPVGGSNVSANPNTTINRMPDGASVDNAYALGGAKTTGNIVLVFVDKASSDLIWKVQISTLIEDVNRVDTGRLRDAVRQGLASLPEAS